jgi:uncharacterized protein YjbJ (UPF0337 family)
MLGRAKEQWGRLAHDDLVAMEGRREELIGKIRQAYGLSQDEAEQQVAQFERDMAQQKDSGPGA